MSTIVDHTAITLALRARLNGLVVCSTGSVSLSATTNGYARATGSFLDDGLAKGMELVAAGFSKAANNGARVITDVTATLVSCDGCVAEAAASGRTLAVGLPTRQAWENAAMTVARDPGAPYLDEQYTRGPSALTTLGAFGRITGEPMYFPRINVPSGVGIAAASRYADAILALFPPGDVFQVAGTTVHVRADHAPYAGQLQPGDPGFAGLLCTIPLRTYAINSQ